MNKAEYQEYLKTDHWKEIKARFRDSKFRKSCYVCGTTKWLNLHHKSYKRLHHERLNDFIYLCQEHHEETHKYLANSKSINVNLWNSAKRVKRNWERAHGIRKKKGQQSKVDKYAIPGYDKKTPGIAILKPPCISSTGVLQGELNGYKIVEGHPA